jgi:hypothetical protein
MTETDLTPPKTSTPAEQAPLAAPAEPAPAGLSSGLKLGGLVGAVVGLPASYWFQNEMVRAKLNVVEYTVGIFAEVEAFSQNGLYGPVAMGVVICAVAGAVIGHAMSKK